MNLQKILDIVRDDALIQKLLVCVAALLASTAIAFILPLQWYNTLLKECYSNRWYFVAYLCFLFCAWFCMILQKILNTQPQSPSAESKKSAPKVVVDNSNTLEELNLLKEEHLALQNRFENLMQSYNEINSKYMDAESECEKKLYEQRNDFELEMVIKERDFQKFLEEKLKDTNFEESKLFLARAVEICESFAMMHVLVEKCVLQLFIKLEYDGYEYNSEKSFREALTFARQTHDFGELIVELGKKFKGSSFPEFEKIMNKIAKIQNMKFKDDKLTEAMQYFNIPTRTASISFNETAVLQYLDGIDEILHLYDALKDEFNDVVREISRSDKPKFNIPVIEQVEDSGEYDSATEIDESLDEQIMKNLSENQSNSSQSTNIEDESTQNETVKDVETIERPTENLTDTDEDVNIDKNKEKDTTEEKTDEDADEKTERQQSNSELFNVEDEVDDKNKADHQPSVSKEEILKDLENETTELLNQSSKVVEESENTQKDSILGRVPRRMNKLKKEVLEAKKEKDQQKIDSVDEKLFDEPVDVQETSQETQKTSEEAEKPKLRSNRKPKLSFKKFNVSEAEQKPVKKPSIIDFEEKDDLEESDSADEDKQDKQHSASTQNADSQTEETSQQKNESTSTDSQSDAKPKPRLGASKKKFKWRNSEEKTGNKND